MSTQVGPLKMVTPKTLVRGLSADIKKHNASIVEHWTFETLVIEYYFEVRAFCDGSSKQYFDSECFTVLVSQLTDECDLEFVSDCPVLMLKHNEQLVEITVQHDEMEKLSGVWLKFKIRDYNTNEDTVRCYLFRPD